MDLTSKAIFYYSMTGNTKALIEQANTYNFDLYNLQKTSPDDVCFEQYDTILIGASTIGDGVPHRIFKVLQAKLLSIKDKKIGLFGSGNSIYQHYCGALDLLEELLKPANSILFKFKFESYPTEDAKRDFQKLIDEVHKIETA